MNYIKGLLYAKRSNMCKYRFTSYAVGVRNLLLVSLAEMVRLAVGAPLCCGSSQILVICV
jgi:hypothetical protein